MTNITNAKGSDSCIPGISASLGENESLTSHISINSTTNAPEVPYETKEMRISRGLLRDGVIYERMVRFARKYASDLPGALSDIGKITHYSKFSVYTEAIACLAAIDAEISARGDKGDPVVIIWSLYQAGIISGIRKERARRRGESWPK